MSAIITEIQKHPDYELMKAPLEKVRDAVKGAVFVKAKGELYLPPPSDLKSGDAALSKMRWDRYIYGAEFDGFVAQTERSMVGKLDLDAMSVELDSKISYLESDVDNDALSLDGLAANAAKNVLAAKWHVGVADYQGVTDLDFDNVSIADLQQINPRATIKQYSRENVVDWHFERIKGRMQLSYLMLREMGEKFDKLGLVRTRYFSYVILALDEDGNYYQEKLTQNADKGGYNRSERNYVTVNGSMLDWLPVYIFSDEELPSGTMPIELGMLSPLSDIAYHKYQVSADQKEAIRFLPPTTYVMGLDASSLSLFEEANGRKYVETGAGCVNIIPDSNAKVELLGAGTNINFYREYLAEQDKKVRALGGVFKTSDDVEKSATEAAINNAEQNSVLVGLADSIERGIKKMVAYCAMFEGLVDPRNVEQYANDLNVEFNKEFGSVKLSPDEVRVLIEVYREGLIDDEEFVKSLVAGGWSMSKAEDLTGRLSDNGNIPT